MIVFATPRTPHRLPFVGQSLSAHDAEKTPLSLRYSITPKIQLEWKPLSLPLMLVTLN